MPPLPPASPALTAGFLSLRAVATDGLGPVDLDVDRGECVAVLGASGAGKSRLLRQIADLDPGDGQVWLEGRSRAEMDAPSWRRQVVYCQAEPGWWDARVAPHFVGREGALDELLPSLGLPAHVRDAEVHLLSTGERQRLGVARALAAAPRVLLLDEPTASLDPQATAQLEAVLMGRLAAGLAIVLVTHSEAQARRLARRGFRLDQGRLEVAWA